jgi:hypothetical protein
MNRIIITCLSLFALAAAACHGNGTNIKKSISTSGNNMTVKVTATINGKDLPDYDRTFDVSGMSKEEKEALVKRVMDSLDLSEPKH